MDRPNGNTDPNSEPVSPLMRYVREEKDPRCDFQQMLRHGACGGAEMLA
jgi:hypothetical protein